VGGPKPVIEKLRFWWIACTLAAALAVLGIGLRWWFLASERGSGDTSSALAPLTSYPGFEHFLRKHLSKLLILLK
jgi:H+/Cl- antiporter ClcA